MYVKIFQTILAMIGLLIFCGCQTIKTKTRTWTSGDVMISDQAPFESLAFPKTISPGQAAEDIDFLIYILSKAYGGRGYVPVDSFVKAIAALKKISNPSTLLEFHNQIDEALFLIPDNHMRAVYKGRVSKKRSDYEEETSKGHVGDKNFKNSEKIWEIRVEKIGKKKVLYISFVRFPSTENSIWNGFISSVTAQLKHADSVVMDLRGSLGGDDAKGMELAELFFGHPFEHGIKRQYRSQTPETVALLTNNYIIPMINMKYLGEKNSDDLLKGRDESKERYIRAIKGEIPTEFIRTDKDRGSRSDPVTGYKKPIYILMDRVCSSACEYTIAAFQWNNYVKRVGENTNGTFHFSNAGVAVLPNSKFKIYIPTQYTEYYDHRFIERIGLTPDIKVPAGGDAYEVVKKLIRGY